MWKQPLSRCSHEPRPLHLSLSRPLPSLLPLPLPCVCVAVAIATASSPASSLHPNIYIPSPPPLLLCRTCSPSASSQSLIWANLGGPQLQWSSVKLVGSCIGRSERVQLQMAGAMKTFLVAFLVVAMAAVAAHAHDGEDHGPAAAPHSEESSATTSVASLMAPLMAAVAAFALHLWACIWRFWWYHTCSGHCVWCVELWACSLALILVYMTWTATERRKGWWELVWNRNQHGSMMNYCTPLVAANSLKTYTWVSASTGRLCNNVALRTIFSWKHGFRVPLLFGSHIDRILPLRVQWILALALAFLTTILICLVDVCLLFCKYPTRTGFVNIFVY